MQATSTVASDDADLDKLAASIAHEEELLEKGHHAQRDVERLHLRLRICAEQLGFHRESLNQVAAGDVELLNPLSCRHRAPVHLLQRLLAGQGHTAIRDRQDREEHAQDDERHARP